MTQEQITELQAKELMITDLAPELKEKIRAKFYELATKYPKMKRHRIMRKAGEFFHIKFVEK